MEHLSPLDIACFWMQVEIDETTPLKYSHSECLGHCWIWKGSFLSSGYGRMGINNKQHRAHRIAYFLYYGTISKNDFICHRCDNPKCVNPKHLFAGTPKDNTQDKMNKGRYVPPGKHKNSSSKFHGVHFFDENECWKKWRAVVTHNYKQIRIGRFMTEMEAALAYDEYVKAFNKYLPKNKQKKLNFS